jgi:hypothetical protein
MNPKPTKKRRHHEQDPIMIESGNQVTVATFVERSHLRINHLNPDAF